MKMIYHESHGQGSPLVLLHGFCENGGVWDQLYPHFTHGYHVLIPDLPGFGKSALPFEKFSISDIADEVARWLTTQNVENAVVIGHSLGGYITLELANNHPDLLAGIGLFHSTAFADPEEKKLSRNKVIEFVNEHSAQVFADSFVPQLFYEHNRNRLSQEIDIAVQMASKTPLQTVISYTCAMRDRNDRTNVLKNWNKPLLFIAGDQDTSVPIEKSEEQIPIINNGTVRILKNTGHMGMFEAKGEAIGVIKSFLSSVW